MVRPRHFSKRVRNKERLIVAWNDVIKMLSTVPVTEFSGYAEAEVISPRYVTMLPLMPFNSKIPFPIGPLNHTECPVGKHKDFDLHLSARLDSVDPGLKSLLEDEIGFYYVDVQKTAGRVRRIYTIQSLGIEETPRLFKLLSKYCVAAGGLEGKIKLEATYGYARFPKNAAVPRVITSMPAILVK